MVSVIMPITDQELFIGTWNESICIQQAKECLKQAIQYNKHDLSYIMLAKIYLMEGDVNMAIDVYKRAIE